MNRTEIDGNNGNFSKISDENFALDSNASDVNITDSFDNGIVVEDWMLITYFAFIGIGALINIGIIIGLLRTKRKGIFLLILQLSVVDSLTILIVVLELVSLQENAWPFPSDLCPLYSGSEVLLNTLVIYLLICLNFHIISVWNLRIYQLNKGGNKNPLTSCNDDESNECLVKKNEIDSPTSTSRSLTIDYRREKKDVSVIFPSLLIWFICLSLSIPEYTLCSVVKVKNITFNSTICIIIETHYGKLLNNLLLIFRIVIPYPLILLTLLLLLFKLYQSRTVNNTLSKNLIGTKQILIFCIILTVTYLLLSLPRSIFHMMHVRSQEINNTRIDSFKSPPLHNLYISTYINCFLSMLHYSGVLFRAMIYMRFLPSFRKFIKENILKNTKEKSKD